MWISFEQKNWDIYTHVSVKERQDQKLAHLMAFAHKNCDLYDNISLSLLKY